MAALVIDQHRSVADVAKELDLVEQSVYQWVRQERVDRGEGEGLTGDEREELAELCRQVRRLSTERDPLKRAVAFWDEGVRPVSRYRWVDCQKAEGSL